MSLIFFIFLTGIGSAPILLFQDLTRKPESAKNIMLYYLTGYSMVLLLGALGSLVIGVGAWLRNGVWFDVDLNFVLTLLSEVSEMKELLLSKTAWIGLEKINDFYLDLNLTFTSVAAIVMLYFAMVLSSDLRRR